MLGVLQPPYSNATHGAPKVPLQFSTMNQEEEEKNEEEEEEKEEDKPPYIQILDSPLVPDVIYSLM